MNRADYMSAFKKVFLTLAILYMTIPIMVVVLMTFSPGQFFSFPQQSFSERWYISFFNDESWISSILTSVLIAMGSGLLALLIGIPSALGLSIAPKKIRTFLISFFGAPLLIPLIVFAAGIFLLFSILHLTDTFLGFIIAHGVLGLPFIIMATLSSLFSIDRKLELAARNLGASVTEVFYKIKLPLCKAGIITGFVFAALNSFNEVVVALFLSNRKVIPFSIKMWEGFRYEINPTIAVAAMTTIIMAFLMILFLNKTISTKYFK
jgi:putative spermidine/putrescine transport system permease protein